MPIQVLPQIVSLVGEGFFYYCPVPNSYYGSFMPHRFEIIRRNIQKDLRIFYICCSQWVFLCMITHKYWYLLCSLASNPLPLYFVPSILCQFYVDKYPAYPLLIYRWFRLSRLNIKLLHIIR